MNPNVERSDLKLPAPSYSENILSANNETQTNNFDSGLPAQAVQQVKPLGVVNINTGRAGLVTDASRAGASSSSNPMTMTHTQDTPPAAGEGDLEEYWIDRFRQVMTQTNDPKLQADGLYKLRSDYLLARFGKELKDAE